ncbi:hypothetical protein Tco_0518228 [Tanacetum coccineum]
MEESTKNILYYLLVEKMYPLTKHTLHQMFNDVKLQVDYEYEMAFKLFRLVKKQLKEGYGRIVGIKGLLEVTTAKGSIISSAKERASGEAPRSFVALLSFVFPFFLFIMSKRNLGSVTQSEFIGFIKEYGIAMCYDHQLLSTKQNALDAPEGYIPLYLSLFSIGNLRLPFNHFCHDVFEFSNCHFPLLDPFGVARMSFRNFMKRPGQVPTFFARPADQPVDVGSPFMDHSKAADDNDQGESSFVPKNQDVVGLELAIVEDRPFD